MAKGLHQHPERRAVRVYLACCVLGVGVEPSTPQININLSEPFGKHTSWIPYNFPYENSSNWGTPHFRTNPSFSQVSKHISNRVFMVPEKKHQQTNLPNFHRHLTTYGHSNNYKIFFMSLSGQGDWVSQNYKNHQVSSDT